jgi:hypothetical protein
MNKNARTPKPRNWISSSATTAPKLPNQFSGLVPVAWLKDGSFADHEAKAKATTTINPDRPKPASSNIRRFKKRRKAAGMVDSSVSNASWIAMANSKSG